jgi:hypothetical protein
VIQWGERVPIREVRCTKSDCGTLNRVPAYSIRKIPTCGRCGEPLPEQVAVKTLRGLYQSRRFFFRLAILALPLLFFAWVGSGSHDPTIRGAAECQAQPRPTVGDYLITDFSDRVVPFAIETDRGLDYLVKLERTDNRFASLTFFIVGGQNFETKVPIGNYALKYVAGKTWCGRRLFFGNKQAEQGHIKLAFSATGDGYEGHTVTLYGVANGNFSTDTIPMGDF